MAMDNHTTASPRDGLGAKLDELQRRVSAAKSKLTPANALNNPWVRIGLGVAVGIAIGSRLGRRSSGPAHHESIGHAILRAGLAAAAAMLVRQALEADASVTRAPGVRA